VKAVSRHRSQITWPVPRLGTGAATSFLVTGDVGLQAHRHHGRTLHAKATLTGNGDPNPRNNTDTIHTEIRRR
jgi:hypothetical protein